MRERVRDVERLRHILEAIEGIQESQKIYSFEDIEKNSIIFYGFVKYLEIIGEAVYMLTKEFRAEHPEVEWDIIEKMRHVLVHGYYHIKPAHLWRTIETDLPDLKPFIMRLYDEERNNAGDAVKEPMASYGHKTLEIGWCDASILDIIRSLNRHKYPSFSDADLDEWIEFN